MFGQSVGRISSLAVRGPRISANRWLSMTTNRAIDEVDDFRQGSSAMSQTRITKFIRIFDVTNPVDRARLDMERGRRNLEDALRVAEDQESQSLTLSIKLLTSGALKPRIPGFVLTGKAALETPEMRAAIQKSFREDGLLEIMQ